MKRSLLRQKIATIFRLQALVFAAILLSPIKVYALKTCGDSTHGGAVHTSIDLGCYGRGNAVTDFMFAIIRFLSVGAGLIIVASLVYAGIQYTGSRGDPNAVGQARKRLEANVVALFLFVFAFAIINYVVPGALLKP